MKRELLLATLLAVASFSVYRAHGQTSFEGVNLTNGRDLFFKGANNDPTDAGDIVFQTTNGEELTRIRSHFDAGTGLASIYFSSTPLIKSIFEGNLN